MPCASIPTCVRELMPYLIFVQGVCPDETRSALNMVRANAAWLPTFCTNGTLQAGLDEAFDRGTFRDPMTCAVRFGGFRPEHLGHASMSALRAGRDGARPAMARASTSALGLLLDASPRGAGRSASEKDADKDGDALLERGSKFSHEI